MQPGDLSDILDQYESFLVHKNRAPSTIKRRRYDVQRFLDTTKGLGTVRGREVSDYLANADLAATTRSSYRDSLTGFFRWAASENHIPEDPTQALPKRGEYKPATPPPATRAAIRQGLRNAPEREAMMIKLAFVAGLKPAEIANAHPRDIRQDAHGDHWLKARMGNRKSREVRIPSSLADDFRAYNKGNGIGGRRGEGRLTAAYITRRVGAVMPGRETPGQIRLAHFETLERMTMAETWQVVVPFYAPESLPFLDYSDLGENDAVRRHLDGISRGLAKGSALANATTISASKNLLETLFTLVLEERSVAFKDTRLPRKYGAVSKALGIEGASIPESEKATNAVDTVLGALTDIVTALGQIRNDTGTDHGGTVSIEVEQKFARLQFNAAVTVAEFVAETWQAVREKGSTA